MADQPITFHTPIRARHQGVVRAGLSTLDGRLGDREVVAFVIDPANGTGGILTRFFDFDAPEGLETPNIEDPGPDSADFPDSAFTVKPGEQVEITLDK